MSKLFGRVHCHVCPLKELCPWAQPDASYAISRFDLWESKWQYFDAEVCVVPKRPREPSVEESKLVAISTLNCPLKKVLG